MFRKKSVAVAIITSCLIPFIGNAKSIPDSFSITAEVAYLKRAPRGQSACLAVVEAPLNPVIVPTTDTTCVSGSCQVNSKQIVDDQGYDVGLRASLAYNVGRRGTWELRYLGLLNWKGGDSASCPNSLQYPFSDGINDTLDYQNADKVHGTCNSEFYTVDGNYWGHVTPQRIDYFSVSWVVGLRFAKFDEQFKLRYQRQTSNSYYTVNTQNYLGGIQLGGDFEGNLGRNFTWGIPAKIGALVNYAKANDMLKDRNNQMLLFQANPNDFNLCFFGEIAPFVLFNLFKNLVLRISYEAMVFSNVALAIDQIHFSNVLNGSSSLNRDGTLLLYGVFGGLTLTF